jgi:phosphate transport system protein
MTTDIQTSLLKLKQHIIFLGTIVEENLRNSIKSVSELDQRLARNVQYADSKINSIEVDVEEECLKILALHQPVASDLRLVVTVLKINTTLERIGDIASKIADKVLLITNDLQMESKPDKMPIYPAELEPMSTKTMEMFSQALNAFVDEDSDLAYRVRLADDQVDEAKSKIRDQLEKIVYDNPEQRPYLPILLSVARGLERIADHSTNIAEDIIYMLQGRIIRHDSDI